MRLLSSSSPLFFTSPSTNRHCCFLSSTKRRFRCDMVHHRRKDKIVVIMGATGTGKSRLSVDLASVFPAEVVNSDKIQVYRGLHVTTNKIPQIDRRSVPHHLLGDFRGQLSAGDFRSAAALAVSAVSSRRRRRLPLLVGGSNSFIYALLARRFDPDADVFYGPDPISADLRYNCCFLWVDVSLPVLSDYVSKRVDDMLDSGMFQELAEFYHSESDRNKSDRIGLRKAIGVPEFDKYFRKYPPGTAGADPVRARAYEEAVKEIKENTCRLVKRQLGKIQRLREAGWDLRRIDATEAFRSVMAAESEERWSEIWEAHVLNPSVKIVKRFLDE